MKTGNEEGSFAFPKPVPFNASFSFRDGNFVKASLHAKEAFMRLHLPSFSTKCRGFLALMIQLLRSPSLHPCGIYTIVFPCPPGTGKKTNESSWEENPLKTRDV